MSNNNSIVRNYISKQDSAYVLDHLEELLNRPDIHDVYSKNIAGMEVEEFPGLEVHGKYKRDGDKRRIQINPDLKSGWTGENELGIPSLWRSQRNTMLHEAIGHGLLESLYGYQKKPHALRGEEFPYYVQAYSNTPYLEGTSEKTQEKSKNAITLLEELIRIKMKDYIK